MAKKNKTELMLELNELSRSLKEYKDDDIVVYAAGLVVEAAKLAWLIDTILVAQGTDYYYLPYIIASITPIMEAISEIMSHIPDVEPMQ